MTYNKFEDLPCWQKARELCQMIFKLINKGQFARDYNLKDQILYDFLGIRKGRAGKCSRNYTGPWIASTSARKNSKMLTAWQVSAGSTSRDFGNT